MYATAGVEVTWLSYATVMAAPTVVGCGMVLVAKLPSFVTPAKAGVQAGWCVWAR